MGSKPPKPHDRQWCLHRQCRNEIKSTFTGIRAKHFWEMEGIRFQREFMVVKPSYCAVFLEELCWKHLPKKKKKAYKHKVEAWVRENHTLNGANLIGVDLSNINLQGVSLTNAKLMHATLIKINLQGADLRNADLCGANLEEANFQKALLTEARLHETKCKNADFSDANLAGTIFEGASLTGVIWGGARYLSWANVQNVGDEKWDNVKEKGWLPARSAYRHLKNYFHVQGKYDEEGIVYFREKLMEKHIAFWQCYNGHQPNEEPTKGKSKRFLPHLFQKIKDFFYWLGLVIFHKITGFGERWWWTVLWALGFVAFFGLIYWGGSQLGWFQFDFKPKMIPNVNFFTYIYLSVVTFATLGFGDITPLNTAAQVPVIIEVILGYVFLGLIVTIIARRFGR